MTNRNFISTRKMSHEEWLEKRRSSIGGSDIAVILGISPYKTPFGLWMEKTGRKEPDDLSGNKYVQFGVKLEPVIADWFAEEHPEYKVMNDNKIRYHEKYKFLSANLDRIIVDEWGERGVLEIKTTTSQGFKKWQSGGALCDGFKIDQTYYAQMQHYLAITGFKYGMFAILVDKDLKTTIVHRDDRWIDRAVAKAVEWYENHIVADQEPPLVNADFEMVVPEQGSVAMADIDVYAAWKKLNLLKVEKKELEALIEEQENIIKGAVVDAETLTFNGEVLCTWKPQTSNRFDSTRFKKENPIQYQDYTKQTTTRVFRLKGAKEDE